MQIVGLKVTFINIHFIKEDFTGIWGFFSPYLPEWRWRCRTDLSILVQPWLRPSSETCLRTGRGKEAQPMPEGGIPSHLAPETDFDLLRASFPSNEPKELGIRLAQPSGYCMINRCELMTHFIFFPHRWRLILRPTESSSITRLRVKYHCHCTWSYKALKMCFIKAWCLV